MNFQGRKVHRGRPLPKLRPKMGQVGLMLAIGLFLMPAGLLAGAAVNSATFRTKDLVVTGISPDGFVYSPGRLDAQGLAPFQVRGDPVLVAKMSREHLTVTGGLLKGKVAPNSGQLAYAALSGNVQVVSVINPKEGQKGEAQQIELESASAQYQNLTWSKGASTLQATKLTFPNPILVKGESQSKGTSYWVHASSGSVFLKQEAPGESQTLDSAALSGSVTMSFSSKILQGQGNPYERHLTASADRATFERNVDPQSQAVTYKVKLLGHVNIAAQEPSGNTVLTDLSGIEVTLNSQFEVLGYEGLDDKATGYFQPHALLNRLPNAADRLQGKKEA